MKKRTISKIKKMAEEQDSIKLYKVATGETSLLAYLNDYVAENDLGSTQVGNTTLDKVLSANRKRFNQLTKWVEAEDNDTYADFYRKEIKILEDYAETVFMDLITLPNAEHTE